MEHIQTIRGRRIGAAEISEIQHFVEENSQRNRSWLSRELCCRWEWKQANGRLKEVACRELLLRLERQGYLRLPPRQREGSNAKRQGSWVSYTGKSGVFVPRGFSQNPLEGQLGHYGEAQFELMQSRAERKFWNILIERYHYLGYRPVAGPSLKYLIYLKGYVVGCLGWGAAVWKLTLRDAYIGWDPSSMERHLNSVVNNVRFLILPWVKVRYLASHVLAVGARQVRTDWQRLYATPAYLLETFVDTSLFLGTCYRAANWVYLGRTRGMSKRGLSFYVHGQPKDLYVYPLVNDFRERLSDG